MLLFPYNFNNIWVFDIESDNLLDKVTKIHCIVITKASQPEISYVFRSDATESSKTIKAGVLVLKQILDSKDQYICGHNIAGFDLGVFYKLFGLDILAYYKKVIDTMLIAQLMYPKFRVEKLHSKYPLFDYEKKSHSLDVWAKRAGQNQKTDYTGGWETISDEMVNYCIDDVRANISVLSLLGRNSEYFPPLGVIELENYVALYGSIQTVYGHKINRKKMESIKHQHEFSVREIDLQLAGCFLPIFKDVTNGSFKTKTKKLINLFESFGGSNDMGKWVESPYSVLNTVVVSKSIKLKWSIYPPDKWISSYINGHIMGNFLLLGNPSVTVDHAITLLKSHIVDLLKSYSMRRSSRWLEVDIASTPRFILESIVCPVSYTKAGKPKSKKMNDFKEDEEDGKFYRKLIIHNYGLASKIELEHFKPNSRQSIIKFLKLKYDIVPDTLTDSESYKLDSDWFSGLDIQESSLLSERFKHSKIISECNTILNNLTDDDRVHHTLNSNATNTGRMCLKTDVKISTKEKGHLSFSEVKVGDLVYGYDIQDGKRKLTKVTAINVYKNQPIGTLSNGDVTFECTEDHQWITKRGLVKAKDILPTDIIILGNGGNGYE